MASPEFLGRGIKFPFQVNGRGGIAQSADETLVQESISQILLTSIGERFHRRGFGSGLQDLVFEPNNTLFERLARTVVVEALERFEPRIEILDVSIFADPDRAELANIQISYIIASTNKEGNLVLPFFLNGEATNIIG